MFDPRFLGDHDTHATYGGHEEYFRPNDSKCLMLSSITDCKIS